MYLHHCRQHRLGWPRPHHQVAARFLERGAQVADGPQLEAEGVRGLRGEVGGIENVQRDLFFCLLCFRGRGQGRVVVQPEVAVGEPHEAAGLGVEGADGPSGGVELMDEALGGMGEEEQEGGGCGYREEGSEEEEACHGAVLSRPVPGSIDGGGRVTWGGGVEARSTFSRCASVM